MIATALSSIALTVVLINHALTPGAVRPLTLQVVCTTRWGTDERHVSLALKQRVFTAYAIPADQQPLFVVDHLIPRELAGADVFENLWPEERVAAQRKDRQESALHAAVCAPHPLLTLKAAQKQMSGWSEP